MIKELEVVVVIVAAAAAVTTTVCHKLILLFLLQDSADELIPATYCLLNCLLPLFWFHALHFRSLHPLILVIS